MVCGTRISCCSSRKEVILLRTSSFAVTFEQQDAYDCVASVQSLIDQEDVSLASCKKPSLCDYDASQCFDE